MRNKYEINEMKKKYLIRRIGEENMLLKKVPYDSEIRYVLKQAEDNFFYSAPEVIDYCFQILKKFIELDENEYNNNKHEETQLLLKNIEETQLLLKNIYDYTQKIGEISLKYTDIIKSLNTKLQEHEDKTKLTFKHAKLLKEIKIFKKNKLKETVIINNRIENKTNSFLWKDLHNYCIDLDLYTNFNFVKTIYQRYSPGCMDYRVRDMMEEKIKNIQKFKDDEYVSSVYYENSDVVGGVVYKKTRTDFKRYNLIVCTNYGNIFDLYFEEYPNMGICMIDVTLYCNNTKLEASDINHINLILHEAKYTVNSKGLNNILESLTV